MRDLTDPQTREKAREIAREHFGGSTMNADMFLHRLAEAGITLIEGATVTRARWLKHPDGSRTLAWNDVEEADWMERVEFRDQWRPFDPTREQD